LAFEEIIEISDAGSAPYFTLSVPGVQHYTVDSFLNHNSGKTLLFIYAMIARALKCKGSRHGIVRNINRDCRQKVGMVSMPELHRMIGIDPTHDKSNNIFVYPGGSEIWLMGLDDAGARDQRVLGHEFSTLLFEEANEIPYLSTVTACTRLSQKNDLKKRAWYSCNPPPKVHWLYTMFIERLGPVDRRPCTFNVHSLLMNPSDNLEHIDPLYMKRLDGLPERQRLRFRDGIWGMPMEGVLWRREWIEDNRISNVKEEIVDTVVGVDPAVGGACMTGIIAAAIGESGHVYVLADRTSHGTPAEWSAAVIQLKKEVGASKVVAESNQGGELVREVIRHTDPSCDIELIHASSSKSVRAEPVSALAERGKLHHVGEHLELESQLLSWAPGSESPDRLDAMVHAVAWLTKNVAGAAPQVAGSLPMEMGEEVWNNL
jgi:hypothetical protein